MLTVRNYLEKLRFTLTVDNLGNKEINPQLFIGLNGEKNHKFNLSLGQNKLVFDETVYSKGDHFLSVIVNDNINDAWNISAFKIVDLKIHGISITHNIFQSVYLPTYDEDYLNENPSAPTEIKSGLYIGNRGVWKWFFKTPIYENKVYKIGLW